MDIITRAEWGARSPKSTPTHVAPSERRYYVVHHSGGPVTQTVRAIQDWCMDGRGFNDIDYNHLVRGSTGEIYEGRGWDIVGAHTTGYNTTGVGVCIIGTDQASDAAKRAVRWLYEQYNKRCRRTLDIRGHRQLATTGTDCPGDRVYAWVHTGMPTPAPAPAAQEDDMPTVDDIVTGLLSAKLGSSGPTVGVALQNGISDAARDKILAANLGSSGPTVGVALQTGAYHNSVSLLAKAAELLDKATVLLAGQSEASDAVAQLSADVANLRASLTPPVNG